jgi:hypothetical protein
MGHMQALLTGGFPIDIDSMPPAMQATIRKAIAARDAAAAK